MELSNQIFEWVLTILSLLIMFSPFFIIRLKKFEPVGWKHVIYAYLISFILFFAVEWVIELITQKIVGWTFVRIADEIFEKILFLPLLIWPLFIFYGTKIIYKKFNFKNFLLSLIASIALFGILVLISFWLMVLGLAWASHYIS